jgi:hypothetical protein
MEVLSGHLERLGAYLAESETKALSWAEANLSQPHLFEILDERELRLERIEKEIRSNLEHAINAQAIALEGFKENAARAGSTLFDGDAAARHWKQKVRQSRLKLESLKARLSSRTAEIERQRSLSALPPQTMTGALVIPRGLLDVLLKGEAFPEGPETAERTTAEHRRAIREVMEHERLQGYQPREVSGPGLGYDIESVVLADREGFPGPAVRFISVKVREPEIPYVTVTTTEAMTALNKRDGYYLVLAEPGPPDSGVRPLQLRYFEGFIPSAWGEYPETRRVLIWELEKHGCFKPRS